MSNETLLKELVKVKALFQQRTILAAMGIPGLVQCPTCGDHHEAEAVPFTCQTGDGV